MKTFKQFLQELISTLEPVKAPTSDDLIKLNGGATMLSGTAPKKPFENPSFTIPGAENNGWKGSRQIARRVRSITPTAKFMGLPGSQNPSSS